MVSLAYPSSGEPFRSRALAVWGHFSPELLITAIGATIVVGLRPLPGIAGYVVPIAIMAFVIASWILMRKHDRRLCESCMSSMPLNPSKLAQHYRRRFWMSHTGAEKRFLLPYLAVLIGSNLMTFTLAGRIAWAVIQSSMIFLVLSYSTHRKFQPWCPWCSDGGGGSEQNSDDPVTPDPVYNKPLQLT
ncbi:MAG: hypothetical protein QOE97_3853 [Pseudonocardiales bacterium]|jgi:hypothetical protein|nr:hypothetical protein [Pseudonocardiales bacterium]